jgi:hypothetical protein
MSRHYKFDLLPSILKYDCQVEQTQLYLQTTRLKPAQKLWQNQYTQLKIQEI